MAIAAEVRQVRETHRVQAKLPAAVRLQNGKFYPCMLVDYSDGGTGVELDVELSLSIGERVFLMMQRGEREFLFSGIVSRSHRNFIGIALNELSSEQKIDYVQCTFSRADAWLNWNEDFVPDRPLHSFIDVLRLGASGYYRLYEYLPAWARSLARPLTNLLAWLISYVPRFPKAPTPSSTTRSVCAP
ncbi:Cellulose synthase catalytic subunit [UDP-forming] [compost metagenome]